MKLTINPTLYLPKGMSREEYIAYAQGFAKPSGESFYTLIVRDIYQPTGGIYPFDVRDIECRIFRTLNEAVEAMKAVLSGQDYMSIYNFKIVQTLFDSPEILSAVELLYGPNGDLLDSHTSHYQYSEWNSQPFFGIPDERVRFHRGDIVEVCYASEVRLGIVEYESRSYSSRYEDYKWLCQKNRWYGADDGNDTFCIAFSSDEDDWDTFFGVNLMSPRYEITDEKRRELESLLKTSLNDNYDLSNNDFSLDDNPRSRLEMAEVGQFKAKKVRFIIYIWSRDDGYIPHIHIGDADTYPKCEKFQCCLKLQTPEYFPHGGKNTDMFTAEQIDSLIEFLHSNDEDGDPIWRYILKTWNKNNSQVKIPLDTPIPDYTQLNK